MNPRSDKHDELRTVSVTGGHLVTVEQGKPKTYKPQKTLYDRTFHWIRERLHYKVFQTEYYDKKRTSILFGTKRGYVTIEVAHSEELRELIMELTATMRYFEQGEEYNTIRAAKKDLVPEIPGEPVTARSPVPGEQGMKIP